MRGRGYCSLPEGTVCFQNNAICITIIQQRLLQEHISALTLSLHFEVLSSYLVKLWMEFDLIDCRLDLALP